MRQRRLPCFGRVPKRTHSPAERKQQTTGKATIAGSPLSGTSTHTAHTKRYRYKTTAHAISNRAHDTSKRTGDCCTYRSYNILCMPYKMLRVLHTWYKIQHMKRYRAYNQSTPRIQHILAHARKKSCTCLAGRHRGFAPLCQRSDGPREERLAVRLAVFAVQQACERRQIAHPPGQKQIVTRLNNRTRPTELIPL